MAEQVAGENIGASPLGRLARAAWPYLAATLLVAFTVAAARVLAPVAWVPHVSVLFLGCVLVAAVPWGMGPSLLAVGLAIAASAFFFFPPLGSFLVDRPQDLVDLSAFAILAVLLSQQTARIRRQAAVAQAREALVSDLYAFSRRVAGIVDRDGLCRAILDGLRRAIGRPLALILPADGGAVPVAREPAESEPPGPAVLAMAEGLMGTPASPPAATAAGGGPWQLHALRAGGRAVAVLAVRGPSPPALSRATAALLDQAAVAIERAELARAVETARVRALADELREALVNSVSHDLKTPLTSIIGSATALKEFWPLYDEAARVDLIATIHEEAVRLGHVVGNALELARFRSGGMKPRREATEVADVVNAAVADAQRTARGRAITVELPADLPMLDLDPFLAERALVQILENAAKYSAAETPIAVVAGMSADEVRIEVSDAGIGFAPEEARLMFDRFYRATGEDAAIAGTGLGLAIARAFVTANGGTIEAFSPGPGLGATFRISYPLPMATAAEGAPSR